MEMDGPHFTNYPKSKFRLLSAFAHFHLNQLVDSLQVYENLLQLT